jgi:hypothetical protein
MTQLVQCAGSSLGWHGWSAQIWYVGAIIAIPLMALALEEAADYRPLLHRSILYWWIAVTFACAWIRVYPYTGSVLLLFNTVVFALWLALAVSSKRQGGHLHGRYKN